MEKDITEFNKKMILEAELLALIEEARKDYKEGKVIVAESMADLI